MYLSYTSGGESFEEAEKRKDSKKGGSSRPNGPKQVVNDKYPREQEIIDNIVMSRNKISHSAIVSKNGGELRASAPEEFIPNPHTIEDILQGLKGDVADLATEGINLGSGIPVLVPGKLDAGKAIFANSGTGTGCTIVASLECVLVVVYSSEPAISSRLALKVAAHLQDIGL